MVKILCEPPTLDGLVQTTEIVTLNTNSDAITAYELLLEQASMLFEDAVYLLPSSFGFLPTTPAKTKLFIAVYNHGK